MADVTLSANIRNNLLALQNTSTLMKQTQNRLATGLKVGSAVDDPVAYFQGKALSDRSSDFGVKKSYIDQGISTLNAATNGIQGIEAVVKQMQGLVLSAKSATTSVEISNTISQFNDLRNQIGSLARDSSYQGLNLINGTGQTLEVSFSNVSTSYLNVKSEDATARGLGINALGDLATNKATIVGGVFDAGKAPSSGISFDYTGSQKEVTIGRNNGGTASVTTLSFTMAMTGSQIVLDTAGTISFSYGTYSVTIRVASQDATLAKGATITSGQVISLTISSTTGASALNMAYVAGVSTAGTAGVTMKAFDGQSTVGVGMITSINALGKQLEAALTSVRSTASTLGANNALLSTRLDFTTNYMNTLTAGAGKLTLADLNEESANMLALQTRQQLGIQSLSMANQAEQGVLGLFR